jgi:hypothetical protein
MQHKISVKIRAKKIGKLSLMAYSAWIFKVMSKYEKLIKPCKKREIGQIIEKDDIFETELFFTFSNASVYLKNRDAIKDNLQIGIDKIKLHKKIEKIKISAYHESSEKSDFTIIYRNTVKAVTKKINTSKNNLINYFLLIKGKILNWNVSGDQLRINNKEFGVIVVNYKRNKTINDVIIKACIDKSEIEVIGSMTVDSTNNIMANIIRLPNISATKSNIKIKKLDSINMFSRCQK